MKIVLNDGTEMNGTVGQFRNTIVISLAKADAISMLPKFMDPDAMSVVEYYFGPWKTVYTGFSRFANMENAITNEMLVWMEGKEEDIRIEQFPRFEEAYMPKGEAIQNG